MTNSNPFYDCGRGRQGHQVGRPCPPEFGGIGSRSACINAMCKRGEAGELKDVHVHHLHTEGPAPYADPKFEGVFQLDSLLRGCERPQGNAERLCRLHSDFLERDTASVPLRSRSVQRGDDPGLPARQTRLRIARNLRRRHAGGRGVRRLCDRRGEQIRSARLRSGHDPLRRRSTSSCRTTPR